MAEAIIPTPIGQAVYPKLVKPDTKFNPDGVFSCKLIVSEEDYNAFKAKLQPAIDAAYAQYSTAQGKPKLKRATEPVRINEEGEHEINAKQTARVTTKTGDVLEFSIALYDAELNVIKGEPNIGSGTKLRMSVQPYFWYVPSQGFGYTLRLKGVQILELVEFTSGGHGFSKESGFTTGETFNEVIIEDEVAEPPDF